MPTGLNDHGYNVTLSRTQKGHQEQCQEAQFGSCSAAEGLRPWQRGGHEAWNTVTYHHLTRVMKKSLLRDDEAFLGMMNHEPADPEDCREGGQ